LVRAGFVFDLDGTLVDNMPPHVEAFEEFARRHGLPPYTHEHRVRFDGKRNRDIFPALLGRELSAGELQRMIDEKEALYRERSRGRLQPLRGLSPASLGWCAATRWPTASRTRTCSWLPPGRSTGSPGPAWLSRTPRLA
jgi:phosphoglycolate phosphatase-like HAD superfamily hydrolase